MELLLKILEELKNTNEPDKYECICSTLKYIFCDENFLIEFIKSQKIFELCFTILEESKENSKKFIDVMKLITKINESIIKIINHEDIPIYIQENFIDTISCQNFFDENEKRDIKNNSIEEQNIKFIIINLLYLLEKNKLHFFDDLDSYSIEENSKIITTYLNTQKRIGFKKLTQIILFWSILNIIIISFVNYQDLKEQILKIVNIIRDKNIFWKIHKLFLDFPFCNIYQIYYMQIFDIILSELTPEVIIKIAFINEKEEKNIIESFIDNFINNFIFKFNSNNISFNPNFLFIIKILEKISSSNNEFIKNMIKNDKKLEIFNLIIIEEIKLLKRKFEICSDNDYHDSMSWLVFDPYFVKKKNLIELIKENIDIYKIFLEGGNYQKLLDEKNIRDDNDKELKWGKKEEDFNCNYIFENIQDGEVNQKENKNQGIANEESEEIKKYYDANYWKGEILKNDDIKNEILNDLD